jgi:hypothetical protein
MDPLQDNDDREDPTIDQLNVTEKLVNIGSKGELFHCGGVPHATVKVEKHSETHRIGSASFREWITQRYLSIFGSAPHRAAMVTALDTLAALARRGPHLEVYLRAARTTASIYLDRGTDDRSVIHVSAEGWKIVADCPVHFVRGNRAMPYPNPERGGQLDELWQLLNVEEESDRMAVIAWLLTSLGTRGPYFILLLYGEQGAAKSSACRQLRALVDPSSVPFARIPDESRALWVGVMHNYVIAFENISYLPDNISDDLCAVSTGGGWIGRALYTDWDETSISGCRPILLNGIPDVATRPDLADRTLAIPLIAIPDAERITDTELAGRFETMSGRIFGALLDILAAGLAREKIMARPANLPRMADAAIWLCACERACGLEDGSFLKMMHELALSQAQDAVEASPIARACRILSERGGFDGTFGALLVRLNEVMADNDRGRTWPQHSRGLSAAIRRLAPALRRIGIPLEFLGHTEVGNRVFIPATKT